MTDRFDIPEEATIKIKRQIPMTVTQCLACGKWERPEINNELYEPLIIGETHVICDSCRKAIEWAKEQMKQQLCRSNRKDSNMEEKVSIEFTGEEFDLIMKYMDAVEATTVQNAILNAISIAMDYCD